MPENISIRSMGIEDWHTYRELRLEMLADSPQSFNLDPQPLIEREPQDWLDDVEACILDPSRQQFIARAIGEGACADVGIVGVLEKGSYLEIGGLYVRPQFRRCRTGQNLLRECLENGKRRHLVGAQLWVANSNSQVRSWYERLGFQPTEPATHREWWDGSRAYEELLIKGL